MKINVRELALRHLYFNNDKLFANGVTSRLPLAYRKYFKEWQQTPKEPVHYVSEPGSWKRNEETGVVKKIENRALPHRQPKEFERVMAGGELIIQGFQKRHPTKRRVPHFWVPNIKRSVVYSEILDKYMSVMLTDRLIEQIHKHQSLDCYILSTKACDLNNDISLKLKRKLLISLRDKTLPYDQLKNDNIYNKYKEYLLPDEEVEWYGLTYIEAIRKQHQIERDAEQAAITPLKHVYRQELLKSLKEPSETTEEETSSDESRGWLPKIRNPFASKTN